VTSHSENDATLGQLVDELTRKIAAGETIDLDALLAAHPDRADELRRLVPALRGLAGLAASFSREELNRPVGVSDRGMESRLIGDYRVLRVIGRGGMGVVYEAEQRSLSRRVALKVLPLAAALDVRQFQRFQLEAQAAACLHHQNIVPVFAIGNDGGVPYYAMQYIEGRSLAEVIRELRQAEGRGCSAPIPDQDPGVPRFYDPTTTTLALNLLSQTATRSEPSAAGAIAPTSLALVLSPQPIRCAPGAPGSAIPLTKSSSYTRTRAYARASAALGLQAAEALDHAHVRGILHRDIKPGNLLLDADGRLWVADFGLAQIQGAPGLTLSGDVLGTLRYMSPEQALGKRVVIDGRTDIYSLGVTLYEMLTLNPAYAGNDRAAVLRQIAEEELPGIRKANAAVPIDLETIIRKAASKDPADRYATARDFADDLRRFLDDKPIAAVRPSPWVRARKWTQRHREATAAILVATAAVGLLAAGWAWDQSSRQIQLSQQVGRMLGAARGAMQSDDTAAALRHLSEVRGHLIQARYRRGPLVQELEQLSHEVAARVDAEQRYHRFEAERRRLYSSMGYLSAENRSSALKECRAALQLYQVLETISWEPPPAFRALPPALQTAARGGIHELLYLLARLEVRATFNAVDRAQGHRRAIDALRQLESMVGPWPSTALWMAMSWDALGDTEQAQRELSRAGRLAAEAALNDFMMGEYRTWQKKREDALSFYNRALHRRPDHFLSLLRSGELLHELKRFDAAEGIFTGAIALRPDASIAYYNRGKSRNAQGKVEQAQEDYARLVELDSSDYLGYLTQGGILAKQGKTAAALAMYDKALELNPGSFNSRHNRGLIYAQQGELEKARAEFTAVIEALMPIADLTPRSPDWAAALVTARTNRARVCVEMNRPADALEDLKKALEFDPSAAAVYHYRAAGIWMPAGKFKEAVDDLSRAMKLDPENPDHARHRSECFLSLGDLDRALADTSRIVELRPGEPFGYIDRGIVLTRRGRYMDAVGDVERALGLPAGGKTKAPSKADYYNAACVYSLASARAPKATVGGGLEDLSRQYAVRALELLRKAISTGWGGRHDTEHMRTDPDLEPIRDHPGFREILKSAKRAGPSAGGHGHADHPDPVHEH
jgi:serine/threonine protein kinase/Tfp pilus assembly protein PilF